MDGTFGITATHSPKVSAAHLAIRIASALAFLYHGAAITFGAFGGPGPAGIRGFHAYASNLQVTSWDWRSFAGGLAMLTGVFDSRGRRLHHHRDAGRDFSGAPAAWFRYRPWRGVEYALTQLLVAFAILLTGPGAYSLAGSLPASLRRL